MQTLVQVSCCPLNCTFSVPPDSCFAALLWIRCTSLCKRVSPPAFPLASRAEEDYFEGEVEEEA